MELHNSGGGPLEKVFCIGIQRSGTTSTGDFCEHQLGMIRRGNVLSRQLGWSRRWYAGKLDDVFNDPMFQSGQMFDDGPWWFPGVYKILFETFPGSKFVLFKRDPAEWFQSLKAHSAGRSPGYTDVHSKVYGRDAEYAELAVEAGGRLDPLHQNGFGLVGKDAHYIDHYRRHISDVSEYFRNNDPSRLFMTELENPSKFHELARFLGFPERKYIDVRASVRPA